jgi:hypothetical protein
MIQIGRGIFGFAIELGYLQGCRKPLTEAVNGGAQRG